MRGTRTELAIANKLYSSQLIQLRQLLQDDILNHPQQVATFYSLLRTGNIQERMLIALASAEFWALSDVNTSHVGCVDCFWLSSRIRRLFAPIYNEVLALAEYSDRPLIKRWALIVLGRIAPPSPKAVELLLTEANTPSSLEPSTAVVALKAFAQLDALTLDQLRQVGKLSLRSYQEPLLPEKIVRVVNPAMQRALQNSPQVRQLLKRTLVSKRKI